MGQRLTRPAQKTDTKARLITAVQRFMDAKAQERGYDDIFTAVTYAEESVVEKFQSEGRAFRSWRSAVWAFCYDYLDQVMEGKKPVPTEAELIALLPPLGLA